MAKNDRVVSVNKETDFAVLKRLFIWFAKHNRETIIACVMLSLVDGVRPYAPILLSGALIDGLAAGKDMVTLFQYIGAGLLAILALQVVSAYLREYFNARVENCMERQNRDMNEQSMEMDYGDLENPGVQEKKRKQEQVVNVRGGIYWMIIWPLDRGLTGLINVITAVIVAIPLFMGGLTEAGYGFLGSNWLTVLLFAALALSAYVSYKTSNIWNKKTKLAFDEYAKYNNVSNFFLNNILRGSETAKDLRVFSQEDLIEEGVFGRAGESRGVLNKMRRLWMQQACIGKTISNVSGGLVYLYAALKAYMGLISIGSVVRYAGSIIKCVDGLVEVLYGLSNWRQAADYGRDFLEYMELKNEKEQGDLQVEKCVDGRFLIEFEHVSFKYPGSDAYVIKDLNLKLDIGERLAIVGKNGSGKTTFIKLLCRLYDVTEGVIKLNGVDIRRYGYDEFMKLFSVVFQDYRIFSLKVGENIAASEDVDENRAKDALEKAGLGERFARMQDGLDTYVGKEYAETGVNISGGERQKMAIARSIYKGAPFVIMDEPTAALDPISECEVYEGFDKMVGKKAAIFISHRLASCRFCSDILVFDGGNVIQRGSHEALVHEDGLYRKLWNAQAQYYEV